MSLPPAGRAALRILRAVMLAAVAVLGGAAFHVAAGGQAPRTVELLGLWAVASIGVVALTGRRLTAPGVLTVALGSQSLLHVLLMSATSHQVDGPAHAPAHGAHAGHATMVAGSTHSATAGSELLMVATHLAAAALVCWWMTRGERALRALFALSAGPATAAFARCVNGFAVATELAGRSRTRSTASHHGVPVITRILATAAVTRRGPPVLGV